MRHWVQAVWVFLTNCYLAGFAAGRIYNGPLKQVCVPGLNCYSCPGALFSCPIGAMQAVAGSARYHFSLYAGGFLVLVGAALGRFACGWLCPFGLVQDLIYKIPGIRRLRGFRGDRVLRWLKYVILAVFVILMPLVVVDFTGQGMPAFCKYICPSGTLMGGIPLVSADPALRQAAGPLFSWKLFVLIGLLVLGLFVYRPFCKYLCPLGAVYGACNRVALCHLSWDEQKCIHCGRCYHACKMEVDPTRNAGSCECIRCGDCVRACPRSALSMGIGMPPRHQKTRATEADGQQQ
ncbi:MAG: 4Fe-4S binding protein [Clostridia bacterium]|nr:4Fe-4S binding protein [Clostridia bacterium]